MAAYGEGVYGAGVYGVGESGEVVAGGTVVETTNVLAGVVLVGALVAGGTVAEVTTVHPGSAAAGQTVVGGTVVESTTVHAGTIRQGTAVPGGHVAEAATVHAGTAIVHTIVAGGTILETTTVHAGASGSGDFVVGGVVSEVTIVHAGVTDSGLNETARNRTSGRPNRAQPASWTWEPNVEPVPAGLPLGVACDTALAFSTPVLTNGRPLVSVSSASKMRDRHRILVGNEDYTFLRGVPTPALDYQLLEPLMYGPATFSLPQVYAAFEQPGAGDLKRLRLGAPVVQQRVDADGNVTATDYKGVIVAFDTDGADFRVELGGELSGRAALMEKQIPLYRSVKDIGRAAYHAVTHIGGARFRPHLGPETGIDVAAFGGTSYLDYLNRLCALAWTKSGNQWTIMPDASGDYRMRRKDTTTIHATIYAHDTQLPARLRRDKAEEPNRIYGTGVTPAGMRVLNGVYPGLNQGDAPDYPMAGGAAFGEGTTDADTINGDGVTVMIHRLRTFGYVSIRDVPGGFDADVTAGIEALQEDAGVPVFAHQVGMMTPKTWRALYDLDKTGYTMRGSHIEPMAQKAYTKKWHRTASGAVIRRNRNYDRSRLVVDRNIDFGTGFRRGQMRKWARAEVDQSEDNWVGTIVLETGAVVAGDHTPGDPITAADVMSALDVRPGMNVSLPLFMGGIVAHVSGASVAGGKVTLTVDTRARDALPVWEVIRRNRESRRDLQRAFERRHLSSGNVKDGILEFSEAGGLLGDNIRLRGHEWRVFDVVAGQSGTIGRLRIDTNQDAEFAMVVVGEGISAKKLQHLIGNPLSEAAKAKWRNESARDRLDRQHLLLYAAGGPDAPAGYWPNNVDDAAILTGKWQDDAGFEYRVGNANVLRVAVYADRNTTIPAGRIMWPRLEPGS